MRFIKHHTNGARIVAAKMLHDKEFLKQIPKHAGCYKWWVPEDVLKVVLPYKYFDKIMPLLQTKNVSGVVYYYIYVGISSSLHRRLNTHVNKTSRVSTLRRTLSSIVADDQNDVDLTTDLINQMIIEYMPMEYAEADKMEKQEVCNNVLPLNLEFQKRAELIEYTNWLKQQRKTAIQIKKKL